MEDAPVGDFSQYLKGHESPGGMRRAMDELDLLEDSPISERESTRNSTCFYVCFSKCT